VQAADAATYAATYTTHAKSTNTIPYEAYPSAAYTAAAATTYTATYTATYTTHAKSTNTIPYEAYPSPSTCWDRN
jgi:hypothetical protein